MNHSCASNLYAQVIDIGEAAGSSGGGMSHVTGGNKRLKISDESTVRLNRLHREKRFVPNEKHLLMITSRAVMVRRKKEYSGSLSNHLYFIV